MSLYYINISQLDLVSYANASYLSDSHNSRSQTGNIFTGEGIAISWYSTKQTKLLFLLTM